MAKPTPLLFAALALACVALILPGCFDAQPEMPKAAVYKTKLDKAETKNSAFAKEFPLQYLTYQRNKEDSLAVKTEFGGPVPFNKNDNVNPLPKGDKHAQPYLKNLWLGYPFSYEYRKARGHTYAIDDIMNIDRINQYSEKAGLPATCWNCKTTKMPEFVKEVGDDKFWSSEFNDYRQKMDPKENSIGCSTCHEPTTMELRITSFPLDEALKKMGKDWHNASRNEMRSLVCAQCHVEYYFMESKFGPNKKPVFPWMNGFSAGDMYDYYMDQGVTKDKGFEDNFTDWVHAVSKVPMLKAQHPEYETFVDGPHGAAGVACADCHMAFTRNVDGARKKISNHQWTSPLLNMEQSCLQCHSDKTPEYLKSRVLNTQKRAFEQLIKAQELSVRAHEAVRLANEYKGDKNEDQLIKARQGVRKGQWFWDIVSAENSVGFHNPTKTLDTLAKSQQYSSEAVEWAMRSTNFAIAKDLDGDINKLVPPILYFSRVNQMDPEFLKSHKWLTYLPVLPKTERVWDGQTKLSQAKAQ